LGNPQGTRRQAGTLRGHTPGIRPPFEEELVNLDAQWVVGFVDAEGCFFVGVHPHPEMAAGYQVLPELTVVQHERDVQVLHALKAFFECGAVRRNHADRYALRIRKLECLRGVTEFFERHPLKTKKRVDFHKFRKVLRMMEEGKHLTREGVREIVSIASRMNTGNRESLQRIAKDLEVG
jgi:hypothetical protein